MEGKGDYREQLAALCHTQWADWTDYLLGKGRRNEDGSVTLSAGYVTALNRLIHLSYADLPEVQKANDRQEADRILALR